MSKTTFDYQTREIHSRSGNYRRVYILYLIFGCCALLYYFGELVDFAGWEALRWNFFYTVHDIHRLFFLAPIVYAGYFFGVRVTMIITLLALGTFLPRALFMSSFPDPLLRTVLFIIIAGTTGWLTGKESERRKRLEAMVKSQSDTMLVILDKMRDGVLVISPDYRIRFMNPSMVRDFGEGIGAHCYKYLHKLDGPCHQICRLSNVLEGSIERWEYRFPDGRVYEIVASPYMDTDGVVCQLTTFRKYHASQED